MPNILRKLNQLKTVESFIQTNFFKGFEYIDRAGKLINKFYSGITPPLFSMGLDGLVILKPNLYTEELKVSADGYWSHYINPDSLDLAATWYLKYYNDIIETLQIEKISRIGWRNYFVCEYQNNEERENALNKLNFGDKLKNQVSIFTLVLNEITSNITIRRAIRNNNKNPVIMLDVDSFIVYKDLISAKEGHNTLIKIRTCFSLKIFLSRSI